MKILHLTYLLLLLAFVRIAGQNVYTLEQINTEGHIIRNWQANAGDDVEWSKKNFDDSKWTTITAHGSNSILLPKAKNFWLRADLTLPDSIPTEINLSLLVVRIASAYDLYFDGMLLLRNGNVGAESELETAGNVYQKIILPRPLNGTEHSLAIRVSNYHYNHKEMYGVVVIGKDEKFTAHNSGTNYTIIFITAVFLTAAIFNLILYFGFNKNIAFLFFSFFCLSQGIKTIIEPFSLVDNRNLITYEYMQAMIHPLVILGGVFLNAFLLFKFVLARRKEIFFAYTLLSVASYFLISARAYIVIMLIASFLIILFALYRKLEGSILSLMGLSGFVLFTFLGYLRMINFGYFIGIIIFIIFMVIAIARQVALQNEMHNRAMIRASRLESQMLKKNIQPHFILNSLTSLQELVEQSPGKAVKFIDSLAEEFQVISKISGEKLIPITDELKICEAHLKIMGFRKNAEFRLETKNISGDEMVPPAIFHTLVENGLTHGYGSRHKGYFELSKIVGDNGIVYKLFNDSDSSPTNRDNNNGTGLKYVEARLEETYPGMWRLNSAPVENGWMVEIEINHS